MKQKDITELPTLQNARLERSFNIYQTNNGEYFYNILNTINFNIDSIAPYMYYTHTISRGETYTLISYKHYNTIDLWWLVCSFNGINNPVSLPDPGQILRILFPKYVPYILNRLDQQ